MRPQAEVEIWPRGGAKSSSAELGATFAGARGLRKFALYLSDTQDLADLHVQSMGALFERAGHGRSTDRYGVSRGWRADLLRVDNGFNVLSLGLDTAARGVKLEHARPDLIILDDVDARHDSEKAVKKKIATITQTLLPTGSADVAVLFVQNRVHALSIASQLAAGTADFLHGRHVHEEPALVMADGKPPDKDDEWLEGYLDAEGLRRYHVIGGRATWPGQDLATIEAQVNDWGRIAFKREAQHDLREAEGGLWNRAKHIDPFREARRDRSAFELIKVAIDPNASEGGDEAGIIVGGRDTRAGVRHGTVLEDCTVAGGPLAWAQAAVAAHTRWQGDGIVAEVNNGGDMVEVTIQTVPDAPRVTKVHASRGKQTRAAPIKKLAEEGRIHHAGVFLELEGELCSWVPGEPSPNRLDAYVWVMTDLLLGEAMLMPWFAGSVKPTPPPDEEPNDAPRRPSPPQPPRQRPARGDPHRRGRIPARR